MQCCFTHKWYNAWLSISVSWFEFRLWYFGKKLPISYLLGPCVWISPHNVNDPHLFLSKKVPGHVENPSSIYLFGGWQHEGHAVIKSPNKIYMRNNVSEWQPGKEKAERLSNLFHILHFMFCRSLLRTTVRIINSHFHHTYIPICSSLIFIRII